MGICKNCSAVCEAVKRCSVCKEATYCSAACQKDDWQFHRRICKKPTPAPPKPAALIANDVVFANADALNKINVQRGTQGTVLEAYGDGQVKVDFEDDKTVIMKQEWLHKANLCAKPGCRKPTLSG